MLSKNMEEKLGARTLWKVIGTDVPHAHIHLMPYDESWEHGKTLELSESEFIDIKNLLEVNA